MNTSMKSKEVSEPLDILYLVIISQNNKVQL